MSSPQKSAAGAAADSSADSSGTHEADLGIEDRTICFCHNVSSLQLVAAIRAGADTIEKIQADTCASTGCGGCEWDVREILDEVVPKLPPSE